MFYKSSVSVIHSNVSINNAIEVLNKSCTVINSRYNSFDST